MSRITEALGAVMDRAPEKYVRAAIALVAGIAIVLAIVLSILSLSSDSAPTGEATLTCPSCGHEWRADLDSAPRCPECGAQAGVIPTWYHCPFCQRRFLGSEVKMIGPGDFRYRLAGQAEWADHPPHRLTCPECRRLLTDLNAAMIRGGPNGIAATRPSE